VIGDLRGNKRWSGEADIFLNQHPDEEGIFVRLFKFVEKC
jgi:hypothetical protein